MKARIVAMAGAVVMLASGPLWAAEIIYDLTTGGTQALGDAIFTTTSQQSTGTGVIDSFVRIQNNGTEQGFNTDAALSAATTFDTKGGAFTHSLLLSAVPIVDIGGTDYREFLLDINQTNANPYLSLNDVQVWLRDAGNLTGLNTACTGTDCNATAFNTGTKVYGLDTGAADSGFKLNYDLNAGSGSGDLFLYIEDSLFTGTDPYVYLYSRFGTEFATNDGFEEWAVREAGTGPCTFNCPPDPVAEPASMALLGLGLIGASFARRKR